MKTNINMRRKFETWLRNKARRIVDNFFCSSSPDVKRVGDEDSGWVILTNPVPQVSYCAGVGKGMSFEIELARVSQGCVLVFDPSPTGITTVDHCRTSHLNFYSVGLAADTATYEFSLPENPEEGSFSLPREGLEKTTFPCWSIGTIMAKHGHTSIDLLKMDIEGFEYDVIDNFLENSIAIRQICVEFHPWLKPGRTFKTIRKLYRAGYRIIHKRRGDHTFLHRGH
jgi:FkbM family methyltransferase